MHITSFVAGVILMWVIWFFEPKDPNKGLEPTIGQVCHGVNDGRFFTLVNVDKNECITFNAEAVKHIVEVRKGALVIRYGEPTK